MRYFLISVFVVFATSCIAPSMNVQRSLLRDSGDSGATVYLETVDAAKVATQQAQIEEACEAALKFLDDGKVKDLPIDAVAAEIKKLIPAEYALLVDMAIGAIDTADPTVDVSKAIGAANVKRIRAALRGAMLGATDYSLDDRNPGPPLSAPEKGSGTAVGG